MGDHVSRTVKASLAPWGAALRRMADTFARTNGLTAADGNGLHSVRAMDLLPAAPLDLAYSLSSLLAWPSKTPSAV